MQSPALNFTPRGLYIGGRWVSPSEGKSFASINPSNMEKLADIPSAATHDRTARPSSSAPITPNGNTVAPSAAKFRATFPAPPNTWLSLAKSTTGTGASGESLVAEPHT